ncbi:hypothetical protein BESEP9_00114 [Staphylococcus phage vB_SepM_BE09]|nr:hypothetical protein BESEP6_00161 [Staphylococcus phage vB_SepM_BE06]QLF87388.1 hypothetical protein BESEP7_00040 [Staphylococcus phage vB_SepM_BE07]QLF87672.1 hypothetical protein BESEP8_00124 [Staphylococcus phage vB_SepM_BE08]QLF87862.1 hypothetical protein BESEP9_00114 [Staphylococcus phage vB_SepM_BE09]WEU70432.1 hypothetical protein BE24_0179 [Staphylococcus phage vB_SepM_BE24]
MIENAKGITTKEIKKHIDTNNHYFYEDLHQLAGELVLKDTHNTTPIVRYLGDYQGQIFCTFKSKVDGVPDITTSDFYGTCPLCDTLANVYTGDDVKNDLATMVLHIIQSMSEKIEEH